jgi:hypothetical protein
MSRELHAAGALSTAAKQQAKPHALVQALGAGLQDGDEDDDQPWR